MNSGYVKKWIVDFLWLGMLSVLARVLPHPADFSPLWVMLCYIVARWPWYAAILLMVSINFCSDVVSASISGYYLWGSWLITTYSALLICVGIVPRRWALRIFTVIGVTLFYWIWTNGGVWLTGNCGYQDSPQGLWQCYIVALPFLGNSIMGTAVWYVVLQYIAPQAEKQSQLKAIKASAFF